MNPRKWFRRVAGPLLLSTALFPAVSLPAFEPDSVFARGDSCLNVAWTPDSANTRRDWYRENGSRCTGADTVYLHSDFIPGRSYRGIAYSYGGEDTYNVFATKVTTGFLVGSHLCHYLSYGDPTPVIAGTDCSGFVCYVWNYPRASTDGLAQDPALLRIDRARIGPGDILVKPRSHTVLVVEKDDSARFVIWESTSAVNGCRERIIDLRDSYWDTYVALRNPRIVSSANARHAGAGRDSRDTRALFSGRRLSLRFGEPFIGRLMVCTADGKLLAGQEVTAPADQVSLVLPASRAPGVLLVRAGRYGGVDRVIPVP